MVPPFFWSSGQRNVTWIYVFAPTFCSQVKETGSVLVFASEIDKTSCTFKQLTTPLLPQYVATVVFIFNSKVFWDLMSLNVVLL